MIALLGFNPLWITLGPIAAINGVLLISYLLYQLWGRRRLRREYEGAKNQGSRMISSSTREWWFWTTDPVVRLFVRMRMGPNVITALGFAAAVLAGYCYSRGWFGCAGWAMIFGASFDIFDGRVARITGKSSRSGAFFDAVMDRFSEGACFLGIAFFFRASFMLPVVVAALVGSMLVSYTRARGEGVGVDCKVGWMQRPERIAYLGVASVFDPVMTMALHRWWAVPPPVLIIFAVAFIALMTNATAIYRMIYIMNTLDTEDRRGRDSLPQIITKLSTPAGREAFWERARYGYDRRRGTHAHAVLFLAGGLGEELLAGPLARGDLPNIARHILERGGAAAAVAAAPATVGPAAAPFVTGAFPGSCDIPGVRWFDRAVPESRVISMHRFRDYLGWGAYAMDRDLSKSVRTIFEYSRQAVNIFGAVGRGGGPVRDPSFFRLAGRFHRPNRLGETGEAEEAAFRWFSSAIRRETDFVLYAFPPIEGAGETGPALEVACQALRRMDADIGRAAEFLRQQGMYGDTALMLAGSYGQAGALRRFDLVGFLEKRLRTSSLERGLKDWQEAEVISLPSGTSMAHLYLRGHGGWAERVFFEDAERRGLIGALLEQGGIDLLAGRSVEGGIVIQSRRGRAHVHEDADGRITYLVRGGDPFGYDALPQVMEAQVALVHSASTPFPDGIVQVLQLFRSRRSGDVLLFTEEDVALSKAEGEEAPATSGTLQRAHLVVPFLSSVRPVAQIMRTADIFALLLEMLGIEAEHRMDGALPVASASGTEADVPYALNPMP